ncbi:hypothetical protein CEUSTIGMA_g11004.t1 [Chlamydomonas eustigma]|uniref:Uncharacterized protein n=1 Tax=Chlamydomonas eustigma TaxID=1157962 RepID=A0A250XKY2_9CHLO|nr:hypothetical protein CEUSTIGMA_g11004.t1 [Chlamydomonas eustigma]|eukprot:GAX83579.1 hypothetical protein CEUSTIGMA_g11004.t1 [Chlamydomonas eustigma]
MGSQLDDLLADLLGESINDTDAQKEVDATINIDATSSIITSFPTVVASTARVAPLLLEDSLDAVDKLSTNSDREGASSYLTEDEEDRRKLLELLIDLEEEATAVATEELEASPPSDDSSQKESTDTKPDQPSSPATTNKTSADEMPLTSSDSTQGVSTSVAFKSSMDELLSNIVSRPQLLTHLHDQHPAQSLVPSQNTCSSMLRETLPPSPYLHTSSSFHQTFPPSLSSLPRVLANDQMEGEGSVTNSCRNYAQSPHTSPAEAREDVVPAEASEDVVPAEATREDVVPAEASEDVAPAEATREDVVPAEATREDVVPAEATREDVVPAEATREDVVPAEATREDVVPAEATREDVVPAEATREDVVPAEATREDVVPAKEMKHLLPLSEGSLINRSFSDHQEQQHQLVVSAGSTVIMGAVVVCSEGEEQQQRQCVVLPSGAAADVVDGTADIVNMMPGGAVLEGSSCGRDMADHELALLQAEVEEERLMGGYAAQMPPEPLEELEALLGATRDDWHPAGRPDASGAMVGGSVALRLEELQGLVPELMPMWQHLGRPRVIAGSGPVVAVGTSLGATVVFQTPAAAAAAGAVHNQAPPAASQGPAAAAAAPPAPMVLGEARSEAEAVCSLGFSVASSPADGLWLIVGHASGAVQVWDLQKRPARLVVTIGGQHSLPVIHVSFFPGRTTTCAISVDRRGRMVSHSFSTMLMRTGVSSRPLLDGSLGTISSVQHLIPFPASPPPPGKRSLLSTDAALATPSLQQQGQLNQRPQGNVSGGASVSSPSGSATSNTILAGEGVVSLCTSTGVHIAIVRPWGDLVLLYSRGWPPEGDATSSATRPGALPTAAWMPYPPVSRSGEASESGHAEAASPRPAAKISSHTGADQKAEHYVPSWCPRAVLAVGWDRRVVFYSVPLLGDLKDEQTFQDGHYKQQQQQQQSEVKGETSAPYAAKAPGQQQQQPLPSSSATINSAASSAKSLFRAVASAAATASAAAVRAAPTYGVPLPASTEPLTPPVVKQLILDYPVRTVRAWPAAVQLSSAQLEDQQMHIEEGSSVAAPSHVPLLLGHKAEGSTTNSVAGGGWSFLEDESRTILGLHWYEPDSLSVVARDGLTTRLLVLDYSSLAMIEQLECFDQPISSPHISPPRQQHSAGTGARLLPPLPICPESVVGNGSRVFLLGSGGTLYCSRLMTWQERLRTLQQLGKWGLGLWLGLEFYRAHHRRSSSPETSSSPSSSSSSVQLPGRGKQQQGHPQGKASGASSALVLLQQWLLNLLMGYISSLLHDFSQQQQQQQQQDAATSPNTSTLAKVAVDLCLLIPGSLESTLFTHVYPQFRDAVCAGPLLEAIEGRILSDQIQVLVPEVVQALVEHCAELGCPERVERCVLHMDVLSLDLDQVIRLCEAHKLYSALTYVYNQIQEYRRPLVVLLGAIAQGQPELARAASYKLLVYLRCIFRGRPFPPGSRDRMVSSHDSLATAPGGGGIFLSDAPEPRAQLLGSLLFMEASDLAREWGMGMDQIRDMGLDLPHPALQILLRHDPTAAVFVLGEAVSEWDAVETDLRSAAGKPAEELDSVRVASQVLIQALVGMVTSGALLHVQHLGQGLKHFDSEPDVNLSCLSERSSSHTHTSDDDPEAQVVNCPAALAAVLDFVTTMVSVGRVTVGAEFSLRLIQHLAVGPLSLELNAKVRSAQRKQAFSCHMPHVPTGKEAGAVEEKPARVPEEAIQKAVREEAVMELIRAIGVNREGDRYQEIDRLSLKQGLVALSVCDNAGLYRACALLHHLRGEYSEAVGNWLKLGDPGPALGYIGSSLALGMPTSGDHTRMLHALTQHALELVRRDPLTAAGLVVSYLKVPEQEALMMRAQSDPRLQFEFLRSVLSHQGRQQLLSHQGRQQQAAGVGHDNDLCNKGFEGSQCDTREAIGLLLIPRVAETFVKLLCSYAPSEVLPFLSEGSLSMSSNASRPFAAASAASSSGRADSAAPEGYDVQRCISYCRAAHVVDAEAYLHERLGDLDAAGKLYIALVQRACTNLDAVLRQSLADMHWFDCPPSSESSTHPSSLLSSTSSATVSHFPHLSWLMTLAPHLRNLIPRVCQGVSHALSTTTHTTHTAEQPCPASNATLDPLKSSQHLLPRLPSLLPPWMQQRDGSSAARLLSQISATGRCSPVKEGCSGALVSTHPIPPIPEALREAWRSLDNALGFCIRCSRACARQHRRQLQATSGVLLIDQAGAGTAAAADTEVPEHWLMLLDVVIDRLRVVRSSADEAQQVKSQEQWVQGQDEQENLSQGSFRSSLILKDIYSVMMEEVVGRMAEVLPLAQVVQHLAVRYASSTFGEFRNTLLGLFNACAYEHNIISAANRLMVRGAYSEVHSLYSAKRRGCSADTATTALPVLQQDSIVFKSSRGGKHIKSSDDDLSAFLHPESSHLIHTFHTYHGHHNNNLCDYQVLMGAAAVPPLMAAATLRPSGMPPPSGQYAGLNKSVLRQRLKAQVDVRPLIRKAKQGGLEAVNNIVTSRQQLQKRRLGINDTSMEREVQDNVISAVQAASAAYGQDLEASEPSFDVDELLNWATTAAAGR